jgi:hypothetical protein
MKLCIKLLAVTVLFAATFSLIGCAGPASFSYKNISIGLSVQCSDCPAGEYYNPAYPPNTSTVTGVAPAGSVLYMVNASGGEGGANLFTAVVTNAPANVTWSVYPTPNLAGITSYPNCSSATTCTITENTSPVGNINQASGSTAYYATGGLPTYGGAALLQAQAMGIPQGDVLITASVPSDPSNPSATYTASQLVQMYNLGGNPAVTLIPKTPTNPSGLTTSVVTVPRGTSFQFSGYAVGAPPCTTVATCGNDSSGNPIPLYSTDNTVIWEVGSTSGGIASAVAGGSTTYGTITSTGLYTAPAAIPASQPIIVLAAHKAPTVTNVAYITVN